MHLGPVGLVDDCALLFLAIIWIPSCLRLRRCVLRAGAGHRHRWFIPALFVKKGQAHMSNQKDAKKEGLVNNSEAAEILGISKGLLGVYRYINTIRIPYFKINGRVMYYRKDVIRWAQERDAARSNEKAAIEDRGGRDALMTPKELGEMLRITPRTLACQRVQSRNSIPYIKIGNSVFYERCSVERWLREQKEKSAKKMRCFYERGTVARLLKQQSERRSSET